VTLKQSVRSVKGVVYDMEINGFMFEELNPTFLFAWKGMENSDCSYHCHDYLELIVILSGNGKYKVEDKIYAVKEGDVLILNPSDKHQLILPDSENKLFREFKIGFTDIQFPGDVMNFWHLTESEHVLHTSGELRQKIFKICASMEAENTVNKQGRYFMLKAYLMQLLILLVREHAEPMKNCQSYAFESLNKKYVVEQILNYFEDHYSEKVSLDRIAENMYLSSFYIVKIFKSETGDTPIRHLINIRLEKAREMLLQQKELNVKEVASSVGYDDAYHFSKLYKKRFGETPSQTKRM